MYSPPRLRLALGLVFTFALASSAAATDWPLWRGDAQRSNASPQELPAKLQLFWTLRLPALEPAWPDQPKMQFDAIYEPVVAGHRMFVGSSQFDTLTAYDTRSGGELWRFHAEGPVRFAPACWEERLYVACDDGYLYCLAADTGRLLWKFRGGPSDRKLLGNERLISAWPARGAPVIADEIVYFAAGIWPFMGIFIHALDARTGEVRWTTDGDGSLYMKQPHNSDSFAGVAPQGPLVVISEKLLIPGGRSVPACYDRRDGRLLYYSLAENGKRGGGSEVAAVDGLIFNGGAAFEIDSEKYLGVTGDLVAFADGVLYDYRAGTLRTYELESSKVALVDTIDRKGAKVKVAKWTIKEVSKAKCPPLTTLIKAGSRLYGTTDSEVVAIALPSEDNESLQIEWKAAIEGTPARLLAADDRLFVVTREGSIHCFAEDGSSAVSQQTAAAKVSIDDEWTAKAGKLLAASGMREGCAVLWGVGSGRLAEELSRQSELRLIVVEPDEAKAHAFRDRLQHIGLGGKRVSVVVGDPLSIELPPYVASLMTSEALPPSALAQPEAFLKRAYEVLRPYGGVFYLPATQENNSLWRATQGLKLVNAKRHSADEWLSLAREGALPGAANWTHEHADASNTRVSKDTIVKAPLGLLWFGGPSNEAILPRHGHGPQPQVVDGRLFIEGVDLLRATDIYTGRVLWEVKVPGLGTFYDNTNHQPGANAAGTNFIATSEGIYVACDRHCLRLDPVTGRTLAEFSLPSVEGQIEAPIWGYLNVAGDFLVGGAEPLYDEDLTKKFVASSKLGNGASDDDEAKPKAAVTKLVDGVKAAVATLQRGDNDNHSASQRLVVMNRHTGEVLWTVQAQGGFRHNGICIGGGRLFAIDRLSGPQLSRLKRRGQTAETKPRLVAFDLASGQELWSSRREVFGTWLSYSEQFDVLVEAGYAQRDVLTDEPKGMRAYQASSGDSLWDNKTYAGPAMLHGDTILMAGSGCDLLSGEAKTREHPLSGELVPWTWTRNYGCNTPAASENLLTFRSGAAGYFDLCGDGGTGNMGGFRSSCTNNLVVAGGLISAPDYTRTCVCSYQNQTSLAMIHMPEVEMWTTFSAKAPDQPIKRLGINLFAPGDRKADDGTLWLEYPSVGGASPSVTIKLEPKEVSSFRRHSSQVSGEGLSWVAASGAIGLERATIQLTKSSKSQRPYTVRLYFLEPEEIKPGERLFDISLQGQRVLESFDIVAAAGGRNRSVVREFKGIGAGNELAIDLTAAPACKNQRPVLCGIELQAEGW